MPTSHRGTNLLIIEYFWTAGTLLVPVAAYATLRNHGQNDWRYFVVLCAIPCFVSTLLGIVFVPESPRWLIAKGQHDEAVKILREAATRNGKHPDLLFPEGINIVDDNEEGDTTICDLLAPNWIKTTLLLWLTWSGQAFLYYGTIIAVTLVFATQQGDDGRNGNRTYEFDYTAIFAAASSEVVGTTIVVLAVDRIGRVPSQALSYILGGLSAFTLCMLAAGDSPVRSHLIAAAFAARMFMMSGSCTTWVSTAESKCKILCEPRPVWACTLASHLSTNRIPFFFDSFDHRDPSNGTQCGQCNCQDCGSGLPVRSLEQQFVYDHWCCHTLLQCHNLLVIFETT